MMKVLLCHNYYQQPGGEDQVFADEGALLEAHAHEVLRLTAHNDDVDRLGRIAAAAMTFWNRGMYQRVRELLRHERPAVVHCTNTFPLLSPAVYYAARAENVPVVQSLHNYRLICPAAQLLRNASVCEACVGAWTAWRAVAHACYRQDRAASAVAAGMLTAHRWAGTWSKRVDRYIALTEFSRQKFIEGGLPAERIAVKRNFVSPDPGPGTGALGYAFFAGRLSAEKGIGVLLEAWSRISSPIELRIAGDGPLADLVRSAAVGDRRIRWLGRQTPQQVLQLMSDAAVLVMPSIWYEGCPKTLIESLAVGTPVVASRLGAMAEMISDDRTGWLFEPGNGSALAKLLDRVIADPAMLAESRALARAEYEARYTAEQNYSQLLQIYREAGAAIDLNRQEPYTAESKSLTLAR